MSGINGDKARFNRDRKSKIARRARNRKQFTALKQESGSKPAVARSATVSA
jgi:hypothetical protein